MNTRDIIPFEQSCDRRIVERGEGSAEVSKSVEARAKNACPKLKSTHHLSSALTFIVLDCSAICCTFIHSNFYGCLLSKTAGYLLSGSSLGCGIDLFSTGGALCLICWLLQEYWGTGH